MYKKTKDLNPFSYAEYVSLYQPLWQRGFDVDGSVQVRLMA